jgi:hypothetical protein
MPDVVGAPLGEASNWGGEPPENICKTYLLNLEQTISMKDVTLLHPYLPMQVGLTQLLGTADTVGVGPQHNEEGH